MKKSIKGIILIINIILVIMIISGASVKAVTNVINYEETTEVINNPERGFYHTNFLKLKESNNQAVSDSNNQLIYLDVDISDFSYAINKSADKELTQDAINALDNTLKNEKNNNNSVILRFVYDQNADGIKSDEGILDGEKRRVEPSLEMIKRHIVQLKDIFYKYQTTIYTLQMGFFGAYGELHSTSMCTTENFNEIINCLLENTPETITISVRTPSQYANWANVDITKINENITKKGENAYRVGIFNDGYLGSSSDLGTFKNREKEVEWLSKQATHTPYGGEAVINDESSSKVEGYNYINKYSLMDNLEVEAKKTHTSYLNYEWNQKLHREWQAKKYNGTDELYKNSDLSDYDYINNHLGYRLYVKNNEYQKEIKPGKTLKYNITVENVGFAPVIKNKICKVLLVDDSNNVKYSTFVSFDIKEFKSQETISKSFEFEIPEELTEGNYKIYLQIASEIEENKSPYLAIRFANSEIWEDSLQANYLGKLTVSKNAVDDNNSESNKNENAQKESNNIEELINNNTSDLTVADKKIPQAGNNCDLILIIIAINLIVMIIFKKLSK